MASSAQDYDPEAPDLWPLPRINSDDQVRLEHWTSSLRVTYFTAEPGRNFFRTTDRQCNIRSLRKRSVN